MVQVITIKRLIATLVITGFILAYLSLSMVDKPSVFKMRYRVEPEIVTEGTDTIFVYTFRQRLKPFRNN